MFSTFSAFVVLIWMLIYVFGGKRKKSSSFSLSVYRPKKYNPNEEHYEYGDIRRTYATCKPDRKRQAMMNEILNRIKMGNFIDTSGSRNKTYMNTVISLIGDTYEFSHVHDFDLFDRGACIEKEIPYSFDLIDIVNMHVGCTDYASYLTITTEKNGEQRKFVFEFVGYIGRYGAREARSKIQHLKERLESQLYN